MISIAHKILIKPNNKQRTYIQKAIRVANLAYNWGLAERNREYAETGAWNVSGFELSRRFNKVKAQLPEVLDVSNDVYKQEFQEVHNTIQKFYDRRRKVEGDIKRIAFPKPHVLNEKNASIYIGCGVRLRLFDTRDIYHAPKYTKQVNFNTKGKYQYIQIPRCGLVKMMQRLRFNGRIFSIYITKENNRYYASFNMEITEEEYYRTHPSAMRTPVRSVGIDLGVKTALTLSDGVKIDFPTPIADCKRKTDKIKTHISKLNKQKVKGFHSRTYDKECKRLSKHLHHAACIHTDYTNKVASVLCSNYQHICMETLSVQDMNRRSRLQKVLRKGFNEYKLYKIKETIENKAIHQSRTFVSAPRNFASSKTCSCCGYKYRTLPLSVRWFECVYCYADGDRDLNAAINLRNYMTQQIGVGYTEFTSADSVQLAADLERVSARATKVEAEMRYPNPSKSFEVKGWVLEKKYEQTKTERKVQRKEKPKLLTVAAVKRAERRYAKEIARFEKQQERKRLRAERKADKERLRAKKKALKALEPSSNVSVLYKSLPNIISVVESNKERMPLNVYWNSIHIYTSNALCVKWRAYNQTLREDTTPVEVGLADGTKVRYYKYVFDNFERIVHVYGNAIREICTNNIVDGYLINTKYMSNGFQFSKFVQRTMGWPPHWTLTYAKRKLTDDEYQKFCEEINRLADIYETFRILY